MLFLNRKLKNKEIESQSLQNPKILEVNLIKDESEIGFDWNKNLSLLALVLFIAALLVGELYLGLNWWEKQEIENSQTISDKVLELNHQAAALKKQADEANAFKARTAALSSVLDNHIYWTNFFNWMEKNTLSTVNFSGFSGTTDGNYTFSGISSTYADVAWQVKTYAEDPLTAKVEVLSASASTPKDKKDQRSSRVGFSLSLSVKPEIFKK